MNQKRGCAAQRMLVVLMKEVTRDDPQSNNVHNTLFCCTPRPAEKFQTRAASPWHQAQPHCCTGSLNHWHRRQHAVALTKVGAHELLARDPARTHPAAERNSARARPDVPCELCDDSFRRHRGVVRAMQVGCMWLGCNVFVRSRRGHDACGCV